MPKEFGRQQTDELAAWLQEVGRRRLRRRRRVGATPPTDVRIEIVAPAPGMSLRATTLRRLGLLTLLLLAGLEYIYLDARLQVELLHHLIVFVFTPGSGWPA